MEYKCDKCEKTFSRKYNLELHYKKKFKCDNKEVKDECNVLNTEQNKIHCYNLPPSYAPPLNYPFVFLPTTDLSAYPPSNLTPNYGNTKYFPLNSTPSNLTPSNLSPVNCGNNVCPSNNLVANKDKFELLPSNSNIKEPPKNIIINKNKQNKHQCENCLKIYANKYSLQKHMTKNCKGIKKPIKCEYCLSTFTRIYDLKRHLDGRCKEKNKHDDNDIENDNIDDDIENNNLNNDIENNTTENDNHIDLGEVLKKLKELEEENLRLKTQKEPSTVTTINNNNNSNNTINNTQNITNTQNIIITPFGSEQFNDVLTQKDKIRFFERGLNSVTVLIEYTHFNKNIPQFNNCYIANRRDNTAMVYDGKTWSLHPLSATVDTLIDNGKDYLEREYVESKAKYDEAAEDDKCNFLSDRATRMFPKYLKSKDGKDSKTIQKRHETDTKLMMYNKRNTIMETKNKQLTLSS
jgi:hypothetical protein